MTVSIKLPFYSHGLQPGDTVRAIINGRFVELRIVGLVLSPEYIYQIREGELIPDDLRFGVFWMNRTELAAAFDMEGAFNDVTLRLLRGAKEEDVIDQLDSLLEEEVVLLRGRDDSAASVRTAPVYNRLFWNFTLDEGEVAYAQAYNITDQNSDGFINETDARIMSAT